MTEERPETEPGPGINVRPPPVGIRPDALGAAVGSDVTSSAALSSRNGFREGSLALAMFASAAIDISAGIGTGQDADVESSRASVRPTPGCCCAGASHVGARWPG